MKKRAMCSHPHSRAIRTALHLLVCILCLPILYVASGCPALTVEMQYRQVEKSHMVGPSAILGTETISIDGIQKLMIGEDDSEVMLYRYQDSTKTKSTDFVCRKKTGNITVLVAGGQMPRFTTYEKITLPVILFDDYPNATRAELEIMLRDESGWEDKYGQKFTKHYSLEAERTNAGYFCFLIVHEVDDDQRIPPLLQQLAELSSNSSDLLYSIPVTVRLYDSDNSLICDQQVQICSFRLESQQS